MTVIRSSPARRDNLRRLLRPRHIAVIGGSRAEQALLTLRDSHFGGAVWPISRSADQVAGYPAFRDLGDLPQAPDATFIGIAAEPTVEAVRRLAAAGGGGAIAYASGFAESGAEALQQSLAEAAGDLALVGPNCFGLINAVTGASLWPLHAPTPRVSRGTAILAQSGNFSINVSLSQRDVPVAYNISIGNQAVLAIEDYLEVLIDDPAVAAIGLYIEGVRDAVRFAQAAQSATSRRIPVVALKIGTSELGARLTISHTASLAGADELYDALFQRVGIIRVDTVPAFLETLTALVRLGGRPCRRAAIFSCSGGDSGLAADWAETVGLDLPQPDTAVAERLKVVLPPFSQICNPQDYSNALWGAERPLREVFGAGMSSAVDVGVLVIDSPTEPVTEPIAATVRALASAAEATGKPAIVVPTLPENVSPSTRAMIAERGLIALHGLDDALLAVARTAEFHDAPIPPAAPLVRLRPLRGTGVEILDEAAGKALLAECGVRVPRGFEVPLSDIEKTADRIGGPVAVKAIGVAVAHKTEMGAVVLDCDGGAAAYAAAQSIESRLARHQVKVERFLVEAMVPRPAVELLVGARRDELFGLCLVVGAGGVEVELKPDAALVLLPADDAAIEAALRRCSVSRRLDGFRGAARGDWPATIAAIQAIARFAMANDDRLIELDVNPLMVLPEGHGVYAADVLIRWAA